MALTRSTSEASVHDRPTLVSAARWYTTSGAASTIALRTASPSVISTS